MIDFGALVESVERKDIKQLVWVDRWRMISDALASPRLRESSTPLDQAVAGSMIIGLSENAANRIKDDKNACIAFRTQFF